MVAADIIKGLQKLTIPIYGMPANEVIGHRLRPEAQAAIDFIVAAEASRTWDCSICGGQVDLRNPIKPTAQNVFRGVAPEPQPNPPVDLLGQPAPTLSEWKAKL